MIREKYDKESEEIRVEKRQDIYKKGGNTTGQQNTKLTILQKQYHASAARSRDLDQKREKRYSSLQATIE